MGIRTLSFIKRTHNVVKQARATGYIAALSRSLEGRSLEGKPFEAIQEQN
jgi:hypothetical protein